MRSIHASIILCAAVWCGYVECFSSHATTCAASASNRLPSGESNAASINVSISSSADWYSCSFVMGEISMARPSANELAP